MKKYIAILAVAMAFAACGDNGNPSGTPSSDSTGGQLAVPDTSRQAVSPDLGNTNKTTPNISDSATPSTPGRSGAGSTGSDSAHHNKTR